MKCIGPIAQLVEHRADNAGVSGSIPDGPIYNREAIVNSKLEIINSKN